MTLAPSAHGEVPSAQECARRQSSKMRKLSSSRSILPMRSLRRIYTRSLPLLTAEPSVRFLRLRCKDASLHVKAVTQKGSITEKLCTQPPCSIYAHIWEYVVSDVLTSDIWNYNSHP